MQPTPGTQTDQFGRPSRWRWNTEIAATSDCGQLRSVWPPPAGHQAHLLTLVQPERSARRLRAPACNRGCPPLRPAT